VVARRTAHPLIAITATAKQQMTTSGQAGRSHLLIGSPCRRHVSRAPVGIDEPYGAERAREVTGRPIRGDMRVPVAVLELADAPDQLVLGDFGMATGR
jgi:hypothetical protein